MKPLNLNTTGCDPISSNCVIWQGPDIPCIKLCKGDTVSDVVYKMATELCEVLEALDVTTYDLPSNCFTNPCTPANFHDLIQIIINRLCCLTASSTTCNAIGVTTSTTTEGSGARLAGSETTTSGCPDCEVAIASCFYYKNEFGDQVTTMQLVDYTRTIGNRICGIVNNILTLEAAVTDLDLRVTALENTPAPTVTIPQVVPTCTVLPAVPTPMNVVLTALEQQYCQLVAVTGPPSTLSNAIAQQCLDLNNSPVLGPSGTTMGAISGWAMSANTVASAMNNMWLTICDLRAAVRTIQLTCCPSGCDGIDFNMTAVLNLNSLVIYFTGTIPPGFSDCNPVGNKFLVKDSVGNLIYLNINTLTYFNDPAGFAYDLSATPINLASNIEVSSDVCLTNTTTNTTCSFCVNYTVVNTSLCPSLTVTFNDAATVATISYTPVVLPANYAIEIWNSAFTAVVYTTSTYQTVGGTKYVSVSGLSNSTVYNVRLVITSGGNVTECPYTTFTTPPVVCLSPNNVVAAIDLPVECPTCGTAIDFVDNPSSDGWYVDLTTPYLYEYSGGSFGNPIALNATDSVTTAQVGSTSVTRNTVFANGKLFVASDNGGASKIEVIDYNAGVPVIEETITINPATGAVNSMCYDPATNLIYILGMPVFGTLVISTLSYTGPGTFTVTDAIVTQAGVLVPWRIANNPVTGQKFVTSTTGALYVFTAGATPAYVTAIPSPGTPFYRGNIAFNETTGDVWVTTADTTTTDEVYVISSANPYPVLATLNSGDALYAVDSGSINGPMHTLTWYPGNGTAGSERMFVLYTDIATGQQFKIVAYNANAPYTSSVFYTDATVYLAGIVNALFYSSSLNKLVYNQAGVILRAFEPGNSAVYFDAPPASVGNIVCPVEDTTNEQIVYYNFVNNPGDNIFWYGLDPSSTALCTEETVKLYLGNNGPYKWDPTGVEWDVMTTTSIAASTPVVGQFTITSIFDSSITNASLLVSSDFGLTWTAYPDTAGNLYANPAAWAAGRVYSNVGIGGLIKITFTTTTGCSLEGPILT